MALPLQRHADASPRAAAPAATGTHDVLAGLPAGRVWQASRLAHAGAAALPTGFATLDAELPGGGWPAGALIELLADRPGVGSGLYEAMQEAKHAGKIRFIGITAHGADVALDAAASGLYDTVQYPLNYLSSDRELGLIELARTNNVGVLGMKVLSGGLLANNPAACFAFIHQFGNVLPLWGIQTMEQLEQFLALEADPPALSPEMQAVIAKDRAELDKAFCRGCGYCLPCPVDIPINDVARISLTLGRMRWEDFTTPDWQKKVAKSADCIHCGVCAKRCPYGLETPRLVAENWEFYQRFVKEKGVSIL